MAIVLTLGDFTFQDMEVPETIPFHGAQQLSIKKMVGGVRQIDAMGADPKAITWSGYFFPTQFGESALDRARSLAAIRDAGQPVILSWDELYLNVYISEFNPDYKFMRIPYSITVEVLEDLTAPLFTSADPDADDLIGGDLVSANSITPSIGDSILTGLMSGVTTAVYTASSVIALAQSTGALTVISKGATLVGAPPSTVNSILQPIAAASAHVSSLSATQDTILGSSLAPGGVVSGASITSNLASFASITNANNQQVNLLQLGSLLGRMTTNLQQINSSKRTITVSSGNLYDIAAREYGDPNGATLIMQANGLTDPTITGNTTLIIPPYNVTAANGGVLVS